MKKQILILFILIINLCSCLNNNNITSIPSETANIDEVQKEPIYATSLNNGTYQIEVESSSSMFRIIDAKLNVYNENMSVIMTLSGVGYSHLYMGKKEDALIAKESEYIYYSENENGKYTYEVPVKALDCDVDCAAWSIKKEKWYDRVLVFKSDLLPESAFKSDLLLKNGKYFIDISLNGGTGRVSLVSPSQITIEDRKIIARIEWNSPYYDYIIVDDNKYEPINTEGNSIFEIPLNNIEDDLNIIANTTAMSNPHKIEYTLSFDLNSIKSME